MIDHRDQHPAPASAMHLKPLRHAEPVALRDRDARPPRHAPAGAALDLAVAKEIDRPSKVQRVLHADGRSHS